MLHLPHVTPAFYEFRLHLDKVSRSYWPGLFHCYDVPGLPRTNNELESRFRDTQRRLLRTTGQKGLTQRTLQRQGAWELLPRSPNRGAGTRCGVPHSPGGLGSRTATLCCASRTVPHAEPSPETNPSAIRSPASEVVGAPGYRYRVTFALLRRITSVRNWPKDLSSSSWSVFVSCACFLAPDCSSS